MGPHPCLSEKRLVTAQITATTFVLPQLGHGLYDPMPRPFDWIFWGYGQVKTSLIMIHVVERRRGKAMSRDKTEPYGLGVLEELCTNQCMSLLRQRHATRVVMFSLWYLLQHSPDRACWPPYVQLIRHFATTDTVC